MKKILVTCLVFAISNPVFADWFALPGTAFVNNNAISGAGGNGYIYIGMNNAGIAISDNGGQSFSILADKNTSGFSSSNYIRDIAASGTHVYVATQDGLSISADNGTNWTTLNKTSIPALPDNFISGVYATASPLTIENNVEVATFGNGIALSNDNGISWTNINSATTATFASNYDKAIYQASDGSLYVGTVDAGLGRSTDGGATWTFYSTINGLGSNDINNILVNFNPSTGQDEIYVATTGGLSVSLDGGLNWTNYTTANGLVSNFIWQVSVFGDQIYAFTDAGISVSNNLGKNWVTVQDPLFGAKHITRDGGGDSNSCILFTGVFGGTSAPIVADTLGSANPWERKTTSDGLGSNFVIGVYKDASNGNVYAATTGGLGISTDGGVTFTNKTTADGLGGNFVRKVYAKGDDIYAATSNGLGISTDGGVTFTNKTTADGLGSDGLRGIAVIGNHVYVATDDGVSISDNGGSSFSNRTTADGLPSNTINQIAAFDFFGINYIYAATAQGLAVSSDEGLSWIVYNSGTPGYASGSNTSTVFVQEDYSGVIHIFAGTVNWGLSVSPDNGTTWTTYTNANTSGGLASDQVQGVSAGPNNNDIYVATTAGLSILSSGTWTTKNTTTAGLGSNTVFDVYRKDCRVFAATASGLSIADNYS